MAVAVLTRTDRLATLRPGLAEKWEQDPADKKTWMEDVAALLPERWDYLEITRGNNEAELERMAAEFAGGTLAVSEEYAARIIDSVLTNNPRVIYGNVPNTGLITNLPDGCCVEVPCLVDQNGVQPTHVCDLPAACAGR